ncbi:hypothetical protein B0H65DRAFT_509404 [Neurospora tetraspora]|uniref:Uncharacterized protein n=1 Tax=Neurospora tetraspora TaxID=94610 RepID=A0AAE0JBP5_9PEZI|nr:hypothetical protein B0H65DRAFT_509404 [Neurospora tetraspora]
MFWDDCQDDIIAAMMTNMTLAGDGGAHERRSNHKLYTPASFAAFLKLIRSRVQVGDWTATIEAILALIEQEPRRQPHGDSEPVADYTPELRAWLHLLRVYTSPEWPGSYNARNSVPKNERIWQLKTWVNIPPVMCVTVVVPQHKSPVVGSCHGFASVQIGYGWPQHENTHIRGPGSILKITMRPPSLEGKYHLMVSFMVPTSVLLTGHPETSMVKVQFRRTPNVGDYGDDLGPGLTIYETPLHNYDQVIITRYPPQLGGTPTVHEFPRTLPPPDLPASATIAAGMNGTRYEITSLTARLQFTSPELNSRLASGYTAHCRQVSPCTYLITLSGSFTASRCDMKPMKASLPVPEDEPEVCTWESAFPFSFPLLSDVTKAQLITGPASPDNNFIELTVATIRPEVFRATISSPSWIYPVLLPSYSSSPMPISWSLPYLPCFDDLPVIDIEKIRSSLPSWPRFTLWLNFQTYTFADWEHQMMENQPPSLLDDMLSPGELSCLHWKKIVRYMIWEFAGSGRRQNVFAVRLERQERVEMVFFVSCLRLDVANRCVVLDGAVLVRTAETGGLMDGLEKALNDTDTELDTSLDYLDTTPDGLQLWKEILPAYVERCRTWEHDPERCEYLHRASAMGVVTPMDIDDDESSVLCSCGNGRLPDNDRIPPRVWEKIKKHLVSVAISPPFGCPFVEEPYVPEDKPIAPPPPPPPPKVVCRNLLFQGLPKG